MGTRIGLANNPQFAESISNLAKAFAPPTAMEAYAAANAGLARQKQQQLADFFTQATDPNADRSVVDRYGIAAGVYQPNQSFYSVDQTNQTSRLNNADDNRTAIRTNAADNATRFAQTRYGAIANDAVLPELPSSVASMFGLPASGPVQGNISLQEGEKVVTPDGREVQGNAKPLSATEWEAQQAERLRTGGQLNDADLRAKIMGSTPTEEVIGPDGNPVVKYRTDAVGMTPVPKGGFSVTTNPDGTVNVSTGSAANKPLTEHQSRSAMFLSNIANASEGTRKSLGISKNPDGTYNFDETGLGSRFTTAPIISPESLGYIMSAPTNDSVVSSYLTKRGISPEEADLYRHQNIAIDNILRPLTGAAAPKEEKANYWRIYAIAPGDSKEQIADKLRTWDTFESALSADGAKGASLIVADMQRRGLPVPEELLRLSQMPAGQGGISINTPVGKPQAAPAAPAAPAASAVKTWVIKDGKLVAQ